MKTKLSQKGSALLAELSIVAVITAMGVGAALWHQRQAVIDEKYKTQGELLKILGKGVESYMAQHYADLLAGNDVPGVGTDREPDVMELRNMNVGLDNFSTTALDGGAYRVKIEKSGTNTLQGIVWIDAPLTVNGRPDLANIGSALQAIGPAGVASRGGGSGLNPTWMYSLGGVPLYKNNPRGIEAGVLGYALGLGGSGAGGGSFDPNAYVRIDGTSVMEGNFQVGGHDITNAGTIYGNSVDASGEVKGGTITSAGNINATSGTIYGRDLQVSNVADVGTLDVNGTARVGGVATLDDHLYMQDWKEIRNNGSMTLQAGYDGGEGVVKINVYDGGEVRVGGDNAAVTNPGYGVLRVARRMVVNGTYPAGGACESGSLGNDGTGRLLNCVSGTWRPVTVE